MSWFDLVAVQEVRDNYGGLEDVRRKVGGNCAMLMSDVAGNSERMVFLYDASKVKPLELVAEIAIPPADEKNIRLPGITRAFKPFDRNPYLAAFQVGQLSFTRRLTRETLPYPDRFRLAAFAGKFAKPAAGILPSQFQAMLSLLPGELPAADPLLDINPVQGKRRARVALLTGCVQQALAPEINRATLRVLVRNGVEVVIPKEQVCCGGLALHTGDQTTARLFAITNLRTFPADVDAVITTAAGCGSSLHEYLLLLRDTEWVEAAETFSGKALDISVFLDFRQPFASS